MTNKARELLERALYEFKHHVGVKSAIYAPPIRELCAEIEGFLAQPEVKRKRLSDKEIETEYWDHIEWTSWTSFLAGVRFAEKHHGIGGGDENTNT